MKVFGFVIESREDRFRPAKSASLAASGSLASPWPRDQGAATSASLGWHPPPGPQDPPVIAHNILEVEMVCAEAEQREVHDGFLQLDPRFTNFS